MGMFLFFLALNDHFVNKVLNNERRVQTASKNLASRFFGQLASFYFFFIFFSIFRSTAKNQLFVLFVFVFGRELIFPSDIYYMYFFHYLKSKRKFPTELE